MISRSLHGSIDVITAKAHPALSGDRSHSNNTAEMTAMIEALSFLGPHGPVAWDEQSCNYHDSQRGACATGTLVSKNHDSRSTQVTAHHATRVPSHLES